LMLCQSYLLQINSTLEINSNPEEGSTFSFLVESLPDTRQPLEKSEVALCESNG